MKTISTVLLATLITLTGCASAPLPQEKREIISVEPTTVSKAQSFNNLMVYLSRSLGDSNAAIKLKDPELGTVVARLGVDCPNIKPALDVMATYIVYFNMQADLKDQKARISLEAMDFSRSAVGRIRAGAITSQGMMDDARPCAEKLKRDIVGAINGAGQKKDSIW